MGCRAGRTVRARPLLLRRARRRGCRPEGDALMGRRGRRGGGCPQAVGGPGGRSAAPPGQEPASAPARACASGRRPRIPRRRRRNLDRRRRRSHALAARGCAVPLDRGPRPSLARPAGRRARPPTASGCATAASATRDRSDDARPRRLPPPQPALHGQRLRRDRPEANARGAGVRRRAVSVEPDRLPDAPRRHRAEARGVRGGRARRSADACWAVIRASYLGADDDEVEVLRTLV